MAHDAHVVHHVPGRMRLRLSPARRNAASLERIAEDLAKLPGLLRVEMNPVTGSILLQYDPEVHDDFRAALSRHGRETETFDLDPPELTEVDEAFHKIEAEAEFLAQHSRAALAVVQSVKHLNEAIRAATNNAVDLKVLLPGALAVWAFAKADKNGGTPIWLSLGMFSFNSFVNLHRPTVHKTTIHEYKQPAPEA